MSAKTKLEENLKKVRENGWQTLNLRNCGLTEIPSEVFNYPHLVNIDLSTDGYADDEYRNKITLIPDEIGRLKKLCRLNLANNLITQVSEVLSTLPQLNYLNLSNNRLTDISEKVANMPTLKELFLEENPFDMLPPEIVARGIGAIRNFYKELDEKDFLYEAKLIVVGEGRVGKTCLSNALVSDSYKLDDSETTEGINIDTWIIPQADIAKFNPRIQRDLQINIWDFGGQEIYHSTHQFFLTKRSIYLLVTESRREDSHDNFFYWLNIIKLLGDQSPVIIVLNKCDQPIKELPIKEYKEVFGNIAGFYKVSLKEGFEDSRYKFKNALMTIASNLPHIGSPLPKVWVDIRIEIENLKQDGKNYISESEYLEICKRYFRNTESALFISGYFHDLGVLLHFQDEMELKDLVILNNEWLTNGVYKILDDPKVIEQNGRFNNEDISRIWSNEEHRHKRKELISLMKNRKFDLCFELNSGAYLAPRLLPVDEIDHGWKSSANNLKFEFRYNFMPKGMLSRLIVKLNTDIYNNLYWRYGVLLSYQDTLAIVREKYFDRKITIEISGHYKREYLFTICKAIREIHKDFNKLVVSEMIPCTCQVCRSVEAPNFFEHELLQRMEMRGIKTIMCTTSLEYVPVLDLTSDIKRDQIGTERLIICENQNADLLQLLKLDNVLFAPERDSASVFVQTKLRPERYGLRDRDFLLDSEIQRLRRQYPNYYILEYYCFENYLYHPENIAELDLGGFDVEKYKQEIKRQKQLKQDEIISVFKSSRNNYQEFRIESENIRDKKNEQEIIAYIKSDNLEVFFKVYSMKDHFDKGIISKYGIKQSELAATHWFKSRIKKLLELN